MNLIKKIKSLLLDYDSMYYFYISFIISLPLLIIIGLIEGLCDNILEICFYLVLLGINLLIIWLIL